MKPSVSFCSTCHFKQTTLVMLARQGAGNQRIQIDSFDNAVLGCRRDSVSPNLFLRTPLHPWMRYRRSWYMVACDVFEVGNDVRGRRRPQLKSSSPDDEISLTPSSKYGTKQKKLPVIVSLKTSCPSLPAAHSLHPLRYTIERSIISPVEGKPSPTKRLKGPGV